MQPPDGTNVLAVESITKAHGGTHGRTVLRSVSLTVRAGEYVAVMGESGVGKSTLLNLIAGLDSPDRGSIKLGGIELTALDDDALTALRRERFGFVFQAFHVLPYLSVARNVALPLSLLSVAAPETDARVASVLAGVGLDGRAESMPRELSGGELQRVAIARALVHGPKLILADEPTGNLDPGTAERVMDVFAAQVREHGAACVLVTHSRAAAARADRVLTLTAGGMHEVP
jgi:putative ABC transport system ATP-binding protein